ncbi:HNH endonuclease [Halobacillus shinanisalinarum]|uniref:HNH endonuclease n=1 Tax=Halobacillus shinanisalinarum TaxID=2932258 RepID=A0ABY4GW02_9BACI|nr:HNH endonuclease [Halobacillus shinanisalinarum]UOQ92144.1 HNH endonuclease [Halobacillus shinanisalinarum]
MDKQLLREKVEHLTIWKKHDQRAPHKPLLILYALGRLVTHQQRWIPFKQAYTKMEHLLKEYGPPRKSYHPEQPFVRLVNDGIWQLTPSVDHQKFTKTELLVKEIQGGFTPEVQKLLEKDRSLPFEIANDILVKHFPETYHEELLQEFVLIFGFRTYRKRDAAFRRKIIHAYEGRCAVCGFSAKIHGSLVGVEAAHIKWHQYGGPDMEDNGLALCSLHHKLFDKGIFTVTNGKKVWVSEYASGIENFREMMTDFHNQNIRMPFSLCYEPSSDFLEWHVREVFKGY